MAKLLRRTLPGQQIPNVADLAGLSGSLQVPGALAGVLGRAAKVSPDDLALLHELLGKPIQLGKRMIRLSSVNPAKNTAILHDATTGERIASTIQSLLHSWRTIGEDTAEQFPEGSVLSQPGVRAQGGTIGPRGGLLPQKRTIPPTATR